MVEKSETSKKWEIELEWRAFEHPFMHIDMQQVRLPDSTVIPDWPIVYLGDYINVILVNEKRELLIFEGYKHGIGRSSWHVVGGMIEAGEDPLETAKRELAEEAGYGAKHWTALGHFVANANRRGAVAHFYLAQDIYLLPDPPENPDHDEIVLHWKSLEEMERALFDGRIAGLSYAAPLALALLKIKQNDPRD